jgi:GH35 family endo-1,4-beta-xylanase
MSNLKSLKALPLACTFLALSLAGASALSTGKWYPVDDRGTADGREREMEEVRIKEREDAGIPWETGSGWRTDLDLSGNGDVFRLSFQAKVVGTESKELAHAMQVELREAGAPRPFYLCGPYLEGNWTEYEVIFQMPEKPTGNPVHLTLAYGWGEKDLLVRNLEVVGLESMPPAGEYQRKGHWYAGRGAEAAWRTQAEALIEEHRMAEVRIKVVGHEGAALPGATVILEQQSHAYQFGTAVATPRFRWMRADMADPSRESLIVSQEGPGDRDKAFEDSRRYFDEIVANFNYFVVENGLKAQALSGDWAGFRVEDTTGAMHWLLDRGLAAKGHVLVWPGWQHSPSYMREQENNPENLNNLVLSHITEMGARFSGMVESFDIVNETFNNNDFMRILGDDIIHEWIRLADQVFPGARLNLNDFLIMANGGRYEQKLEYYESFIEELLTHDVPIDVIGFQNHYRHTFLTSPERVWEVADRFSEFGLPLECSEFDVSIKDEQLQADFTRDFMTAWFAHPKTRAFMLWGFWEEEHWLPDAALITSDWRKKPNYHAYRDLVFNEWWSGWEEVQADENGTASQRVFLGDYKITVISNGVTKVLEGITLSDEGLDIVVRL